MESERQVFALRVSTHQREEYVWPVFELHWSMDERTAQMKRVRRVFVYALLQWDKISERMEWRYVGETENIASRMTRHRSATMKNKPYSFVILRVVEPHKAVRIESQIISALKRKGVPLLNKNGWGRMLGVRCFRQKRRRVVK